MKFSVTQKKKSETVYGHLDRKQIYRILYEARVMLTHYSMANSKSEKKSVLLKYVRSNTKKSDPNYENGR